MQTTDAALFHHRRSLSPTQVHWSAVNIQLIRLPHISSPVDRKVISNINIGTISVHLKWKNQNTLNVFKSFSRFWCMYGSSTTQLISYSIRRWNFARTLKREQWNGVGIDGSVKCTGMSWKWLNFDSSKFLISLFFSCIREEWRWSYLWNAISVQKQS